MKIQCTPFSVTLIAFLTIQIFLLTGCASDDDMPVKPNPGGMTVDTTKVDTVAYAFERYGCSSVAHSGQVVRNLLIQDSRKLIQNLALPNATPIEYDDLYKYYGHGGITIDVETLTETNKPALISHLPTISGNRDLKHRLNWDYADEVNNNIESWSQVVSDNSNDPSKLGSYRVYIDEATGYDLSERWPIQVMGATAWSHGLWNYFRFVHEKENDQVVHFSPTDSTNFTEMEHHMDEVFGYFGASKRYMEFTDEELVTGMNYKDNVDVDGKIDLSNEYNFTFAIMAARADIWTANDMDYSWTIFNAFYHARNSIVKKDYDSLVINKDIILPNWEEIVAIQAIHYLNLTILEIGNLRSGASTSPELFYRYWSAMYQYTDILKYNYDNRFIVWEDVLSNYYTTAEVGFPRDLYDGIAMIDIDAYVDGLKSVQDMFADTYGFDVSKLVDW